MIFAKYCSPSGSDSNPGTLASPYQTIQRLFDNLNPGENGAIRAGTYSNGVDGFILNTGETADGTSSSPKRLVGYPDDTRPVLRGIIEIDTDYTSLEQVDVELAPNLGSVLTPLGIGRGNTTTTGSGVVGLRVDGGNSLAQGVLVGGHSVPANNCYVKDSTIHDIKGPASTGPGHGVYYQNGSGGVISGNVFYNIGTGSGGYDGSRGVQIYPLNTGCYVGYNTFENCKGGVVMGDEGTGGSGGHTIERNIFSTITMRAAIGSVGSVSPASTAVDNHFYNCSVGTVTASNTTETGSTTGDPNFVNVATHDYTLLAGSPATGKGATAAPGSGGSGGSSGGSGSGGGTTVLYDFEGGTLQGWTGITDPNYGTVYTYLDIATAAHPLGTSGTTDAGIVPTAPASGSYCLVAWHASSTNYWYGSPLFSITQDTQQVTSKVWVSSYNGDPIYSYCYMRWFDSASGYLGQSPATSYAYTGSAGTVAETGNAAQVNTSSMYQWLSITWKGMSPPNATAFGQVIFGTSGNNSLPWHIWHDNVAITLQPDPPPVVIPPFTFPQESTGAKAGWVAGVRGLK